ncbi:YaaR family protein [Microaerobacter geothermalis]|uniref:YaaR family protein n=1 Tax=Microaerobacter geothermalis TaxID=674972 RepID=UPI001F394945|nr:YaaR family protein [Microaerobacter geothermalis]MCF6095143.1 YaaR family protein [Microaerobacter geothermalis]
MKIGDGIRSITESLIGPEGKKAGTQKSSFIHELNQQKEHMERAGLDQLLKNIESQGKILANSRTVKDLMIYKSLVKKFVKDAVNSGLFLKKEQGWDLRGRGKMFTTIKKIDEQLLQLTEEVLAKEKKGIDLLERIGDIKGLLLNLYI